MAFEVVLRPLALRDVDEATVHIAEHGFPERAARWREGVLDFIADLAQMPTSHSRAPESDDLGIELRQARFHSHRVIFRIAGEIVEVLRVYHGARRALDPSDLPG